MVKILSHAYRKDINPMKYIFNLVLFQGLVLWSYLLLLAFYSAWRISFWLLDVSVAHDDLRIPYPKCCEVTDMGWLAEQLSNEQEGLGGDADLSCAVLPPEGEARHSPPPEHHPWESKSAPAKRSQSPCFSSCHLSLCSGTPCEDCETWQLCRGNNPENTCFK